MEQVSCPKVEPNVSGEANASAMIWHTVNIAEREVAKFRHDLKRVFRKEIAIGHVAGYTLFARKEAEGYTFYVPPGAIVLFDRLLGWKGRLVAYRGTPDLRGFNVIPLGLSERNSIHARNGSN